jgi:aminoglycoside/choline kinase family phosphotransferase
MTSRDALIDTFLAARDWPGATRTPLAGDASFRRYERITLDDRKAVLMDAPPDHEDVRPFMAIGRYLRQRGYSAPDILAADETNGFLLLEDLGDGLFETLLPDHGHEMTLYAGAIDVLIDLHATAPDISAPAYDDDKMLDEVGRLLEWYLPAVTGTTADESSRAGFFDAWRQILPLARRVPDTLVLMDYHAPNLLWLPERQGIQRVGLLDFQDATIGPVAYDVVSLLEHPRRDVNPATVAAMKARYLAGRPELDPEAFAIAYAVIGAQRATRLAGTFARLWKRDGKAWYLDHLPRVWRLLEASLADPALAPVKHWFDHAIPADKRGRPA